MPAKTVKQNTTEKGASSVEPQNRFANVKMPSAFLHPHTFTAKDGREFEKAYVHFPQGTKVNGIDIGGYSCDVFLSDYMKQQMLAGEQVTLSFRSDELVPIWAGSKDDAQHPYKRFEVNPWDLVKGIKSANETFRAEKAAEREAAKAADKGVSLDAEAQDARAAASSLGMDDPAKASSVTR